MQIKIKIMDVDFELYFLVNVNETLQNLGEVQNN